MSTSAYNSSRKDSNDEKFLANSLGRWWWWVSAFAGSRKRGKRKMARGNREEIVDTTPNSIVKIHVGVNSVRRVH
jgi:hypothetical protein